MFGGCLGAERRRRTCYAAISRGELRRSFDPRISEWGNPPSIAGTPRPYVERHDVLGFEQRCPDPDREVLDFRLSREGMIPPNKIGGFKQTQGTETSKYLVERTSTETPLVVASERGSAQTGEKQFSPGLWDLDVGSDALVERTGKSGHRR